MRRTTWGRRLRIGVPAVVLAVAAAVWWWYPRPTDQELIAALVQRAEHGVETKNAREITSCVSPEYEDSEGLTDTDIMRLALQWVRAAERAEVTIQNWQLEVTRPTARANLDAVVLFSGQGEAGEPRNMHLTVRFARERHGWRSEWRVRSIEGYDLEGMVEEF
jgi:hypothetical protein